MGQHNTAVTENTEKLISHNQTGFQIRLNYSTKFAYFFLLFLSLSTQKFIIQVIKIHPTAKRECSHSDLDVNHYASQCISSVMNCNLFNTSLCQCTIPHCFKDSTLISVPKSTKISCLINFRKTCPNIYGHGAMSIHHPMLLT